VIFEIRVGVFLVLDCEYGEVTSVIRVLESYCYSLSSTS